MAYFKCSGGTEPTGNATEAYVLSGKTFSNASGIDKVGTMPNRGTVTISLDASTTSYTIPKGYHSGSGKVSLTAQTKSVAPSTTAQTVTPDSGKVLSSVSVSAIVTQEKTVTSSRSAQTVTPDSGKYLSKVTVEALAPTGTYPATKRSTSIDMGATSNYRYVNTSNVPNSNSGTYTFPEGSTGATYDMGSTNTIRKVNASNVYAKGQADAKTTVFRAFTRYFNSFTGGQPKNLCPWSDGKLHTFTVAATGASAYHLSLDPDSNVFREESTTFTKPSDVGDLDEATVLFNNEVHMFGHVSNYTYSREDVYHCKISGSNVVKVSTPPRPFVTFAVLGSYIYAAGDRGDYGTINRKSFYRWNGSSWSALANLPVEINVPMSGKLHVIGSTLYFLYYSSAKNLILYKWSGSAWSKVKDITISTGTFNNVGVEHSCVYNNLIYVWTGSQYYYTINTSGTASLGTSLYSSHHTVYSFGNKLLAWTLETSNRHTTSDYEISTDGTTFINEGTFYEYMGS